MFAGLVWLLASVLGAVGSGNGGSGSGASGSAAAASEFVSIPAGEYRPLLPAKNESRTQSVASFQIARHPVTNGEFRAFVEANPSWQPGRAPKLLVDENYLKHWAAPAKVVDQQPVVHVSYFAADAYCQWKDARLPTTAEWEYVGAASETLRDGRDDPTYMQRILTWYGRPAEAGPSSLVEQSSPNVYGVHDMHGLVWEWTVDFNSVLVTGESRADGSLERGLFCGAGSLGAADPSDYAAFMRTAFRSSLEGRYAGSGLGFRCARDASTQHNEEDSK